MKLRKSLSVISLCLVFALLTLFHAPLSAQSSAAGDIVKKCVAAMGGKDAIQAFTNFQAEGTMKVVFGSREFPGKLKIIRKDVKRRIWMQAEFGGQTYTMINVYDGNVAWMDQFGSISDQPTLNDESDLKHGLDLLIRDGVTYTTGKETEIDGKRVVALDALFNGAKTTFLIGKEDSLILEVVFKDLYFGMNQVKETMEKRVRFQDYKKKDGSMFPHKTIFFQKGKKALEMTYNTVTFNPTVKASDFNRPDEKPDLRSREERYH